MSDQYTYEKLNVWQASMELVLIIYRITKTFPKEELYGIISQLRRAVLSIPLNIAEGQARGSKKEFKQFLLISKGSLFEVNTLLQVCEKLTYLTERDYLMLTNKTAMISKMLTGLVKSLQ